MPVTALSGVPGRAAVLCLAFSLATGGCGRGDGDPTDLEPRLRPGLHVLMTELQYRHANLWFSGDAENWPLAEHQLHEMEELLESIEEHHPEYRGTEIREVLRTMMHPAVEALETVVAARDVAGFGTAFDELTLRCNACHTATERPYLVVQRPTVPPLTNLRFDPAPP
jgi:hypothetical protein